MASETTQTSILRDFLGAPWVDYLLRPGELSRGFVCSVPGTKCSIGYSFERDRLFMVDEKQVRKRVLLRSLGSPLVLIPFLAGITVMTATLALGSRITFGIFAGVAGALASAGTFFTRLLLKSDSIAKDIAGEIESEEHNKQQKALDELDAKLSTADEDPRPEAALRDLRALLKAFDDLNDRAEGALVHSLVQIRGGVNQLFDQCVHSLKQTDKLWQSARRLQTESARHPMMEQREQIIAEVQSTVKQVSETLTNLQTMNPGGNPSTELNRLRDELDQSLEVAKNVEIRIQSLLSDAAHPQQNNPLPSDIKLKG